MTDSKNNMGSNGSVTYFEVNNVAEVVTKLTAMGASLYRGPGKTDLGADVAMLKDPLGNAIGLNAAQR
ncbi:VOC family protein [Celerinatantimonas yamalensis]|uniref:VOC domain-containing protein n=1 Tax=Celerinatantimonas yamalensis TaxID=559956 RepID=A0ABW9G4Y2_9GAMM